MLSPASYNAPTDRALCVPVTTKAKGYPFEVALPADCPVQGVAFADQVKSLDWRARHAQHAFRTSPMKRAKLAGLRRNAAVVLENAS